MNITIYRRAIVLSIPILIVLFLTEKIINIHEDTYKRGTISAIGVGAIIITSVITYYVLLKTSKKINH